MALFIVMILGMPRAKVAPLDKIREGAAKLAHRDAKHRDHLPQAWRSHVYA
jgi:hypothetical protein